MDVYEGLTSSRSKIGWFCRGWRCGIDVHLRPRPCNNMHMYRMDVRVYNVVMYIYTCVHRATPTWLGIPVRPQRTENLLRLTTNSTLNFLPPVTRIAAISKPSSVRLSSRLYLQLTDYILNMLSIVDRFFLFMGYQSQWK